MFYKASLHCVAVVSRIVTLSTSCLSLARSHAFCSDGCLGSSKWYTLPTWSPWTYRLLLLLCPAATAVLYTFQDLLHSHLWNRWIFSLLSEFMRKVGVMVLLVRPIAESCQSKGHSICCFLFADMPCKAGSGFSLKNKFTVTSFWNRLNFIWEWIKPMVPYSMQLEVQ